MLVRGVFSETVVVHSMLAREVLRLTVWYRFGTLMRDFAYAGAREVLRKVEKQTLHWISLADSLTLSWDLASLPAFFAARSRFCADLAPCVCKHGGQRSEIGDQTIMVGEGSDGR